MRCSILFLVVCLFGSSSISSAQAPGSPPVGDPVRMNAFHVTAARQTMADVEGPDPVDRYDSNDIAATGAFNLDEVLQTFPPSSEGGEQLVLVDGKPTMLNLSTLPLDMIEGIEVSRDGAMPQYGAFTSGRVINLKLKKRYEGVSLTLNDRGSFVGGGGLFSSLLAGGFTREKWRLMASLVVSQTGELRATDRPFSREQDHRAVGGTDWRAPWGFPAVVQSLDGALPGVHDSAGNVVSIALVSGDSFVAGVPDSQGVLTAAGQRRFSTAPYIDLVAPSRTEGFNASHRYNLSSRTDLELTTSATDVAGHRLGAPPISRVSAATVVPSAYSPFGEPVAVGLVHVGFGPTREDTRSSGEQAGLSLTTHFLETWSATLTTSLAENRAETRALDLDPVKFTASLAADDPARRFDPFISDPFDAHNRALYPGLSILRTSATDSVVARADLRLQGAPLDLPAGPLAISLGAGLGDSRSERSLVNPVVPMPDSEVERLSTSVFADVQIPIFGKANSRPLLRRFDAEFAGRVSDDGDGASGTTARMGLKWAPTKSLLFRGVVEDSEQRIGGRPAPFTPPLLGVTLIDPRRVPSTATDIQVVQRPTIASTPEDAVKTSLGVVYEPAEVTGLRMAANYNVRAQHHLLQTSFDPQDILNNEAVFADRVFRAAPNAADLALGQPGVVTAIDTTPGNAGEARARDVDFSIEYRLRTKEYGVFNFTSFARRVVESSYDVAPDIPFVTQADGSSAEFTPPDWSAQGRVTWSNRRWTASTSLNYVGPAGGGNDAASATTTVDLHAGYAFDHPLWGSWGKGARITLGVGNLLQAEAPYADTLQGYRGSPLGRTYSASVQFPL